jgi:hypothetical protein
LFIFQSLLFHEKVQIKLTEPSPSASLNRKLETIIKGGIGRGEDFQENTNNELWRTAQVHVPHCNQWNNWFWQLNIRKSKYSIYTIPSKTNGQLIVNNILRCMGQQVMMKERCFSFYCSEKRLILWNIYHRTKWW